MKNYTLFILSIFVFSQLKAIPPDPPKGQRWILNEAFSDEFNGTALDDSKWYNYHPQWIGRAPGLFIKEAVSVKDGYLQIRNSKLERDSIIWNWNHTDTDTFTIGGGAVRSKSSQAFYGYYECKFKASNTSMSTTFWLSSDHTEKIPGCATGNEKYGLELDIQECVGRVADPSKVWFTSGMNSNTHFHYTNCDGEKQTKSRGAGIDSEFSNADDFNTFAAWWKNATEVDFIFNDTMTETVKFRTDILEEPFNFPMAMNLVTETYDWIDTPLDENLNDNTKNTSYYDWVRSYSLVGVDEGKQVDNLLENGDFERGSTSGWEGWGGNPREIDNTHAYQGDYCMHIAGAGAPEQVIVLKPHTNYTLSAYAKTSGGSVTFGVKNNTSGTHLSDVAVTASDYQKYTLNFTTDGGRIFKVFYYAPSTNDEGYIDEVYLSENSSGSGTPTLMFAEDITFSEKPTLFNNASPFGFSALYKANSDQELHMEIRDNEGQVMAEKVYDALGGFGHKEITLSSDETLQENVNYTAEIHIRPVGSSDNTSAYASDAFNFQVSNPKKVTLVVKNSHTQKPIAGAHIDISGTVQISDASGTASFEAIPVQKHTISISAEGYDTKQIKHVDVMDNLQLTYDLEPILYRINVYLIDSLNDDPIAGANIIVDNNTRRTDNAGKTFYNLYVGKYAFSINTSDYGEIRDSILIQNGDDVTIPISRKLTDVVFKVKLDDAFLGYASITLGETTKQTSFSGQASFTKVNTNKQTDYSIFYDDKLWLQESARFYNDTVINISLSSTSIHNVSNNQLKIYPNPVKSEFHVQGLKKKRPFTIYQINGTSLLRGHISPNETINIATLKSGLYILKINEGKEIPFSKL